MACSHRNWRRSQPRRTYRLRADAGEDLGAADEAQRRVARAATAAIAARVPLSAIAEAERAGELRARGSLRADVLRHVARAAKRKREADSEYEEAIKRAARLGLSHREIAGSGEASRGTVRAILSRTTHNPDAIEPPAMDEGRESHDTGAT
jgi:DNA-binding NarL/FixJ family response regulator